MATNRTQTMPADIELSWLPKRSLLKTSRLTDRLQAPVSDLPLALEKELAQTFSLRVTDSSQHCQICGWLPRASLLKHDA